MYLNSFIYLILVFNFSILYFRTEISRRKEKRRKRESSRDMSKRKEDFFMLITSRKEIYIYIYLNVYMSDVLKRKERKAKEKKTKIIEKTLAKS